MTIATNHSFTLSPQGAQTALALVNAARMKTAAVSIEAFARLYLPHHFATEPSIMHKEVLARLEAMTLSERGTNYAVAAPRGHAKSTLVSLIFVLWCICFRRESFIVLISDTSSQANDLLGHIKNELETNGQLQADFPEACQPPGVKPLPERWRQDLIITRNGVRVAALGAAKKIRGRRHKQHRPSLIILDDVENEEQAAAADQRDKLKNWMNKAVLKAGDAKTNVVVVGTILHYDSLLANLTDPAISPGWKGKIYKAVVQWATKLDLWERFEQIYARDHEFDGDSGPLAAKAFYIANQDRMNLGSHVLWPQRESYLQLMELRLRDGRASFDSEKQNDPVDPASCLFREADFRYWEDEFKTEEDLLAAMRSKGAKIYGGCDPSLGKQGKHHDDSAIVSVLKDPKTKILYVLDADIRRRTPDQIIRDVITYNCRRLYRGFGFETNHFQEVLAEQLVERSRQEGGRNLPLHKIPHTGDKLGRIQSLEPRVHNGEIRFSKRHRLLLEQLRQFPKAKHDDGPDALEMAVYEATRIVYGFKIESF